MKRMTHVTLTLGTVGLLILAMLLALSISVQTAARGAGNIIKVPDDFATIQAAIDASAAEDQIWVAAGTYTENLSISKEATLYGGYSADFTQRKPGASYIYGAGLGRAISITCPTSDTVVLVDGFTIAGGDATGSGTPAPLLSSDARALPFDQVLPGTEPGEDLSLSDRSAQLRSRLASLAADGRYPGGAVAHRAMAERLERLINRAEKAQARAREEGARAAIRPEQGAGVGGGVYSWNASLTLRNCTVTGNVANRNGAGAGGGVYVGQAPPSGVFITSNTIAANQAAGNGAGSGGGMYIIDAPGALIGDNDFEDNIASSFGDGWGGGLYVMNSPGAIVADGAFAGNVATDGGQGEEAGGGGLVVDTSPKAAVQNNEFDSNIASAGWEAAGGAGGGLWLNESTGAVVRDNLFRNNIAALRGGGGGGGLHLQRSNDLLVSGNEVTGNWTLLFELRLGFGYGGGMTLVRTSGSTVSDNEFQDNVACVHSARLNIGNEGGGFWGALVNDASIVSNTISGNVACMGECLMGGYGGGGVATDSSDVRIAGNTLTDNVASLLDGGGIGGGLAIIDSARTEVLDNRIEGNRAGVEIGSGGGLVIERRSYLGESRDTLIDANVVSNNQAAAEEATQSFGGGIALTGVVGVSSLSNNVVARNQARAGAGLSLAPQAENSVVAVNNTVVANKGIGIVADCFNCTFTLVNNIVVDHTVGISVTQGATATVRYTLWHGNGTDLAGSGVVSQTHPVMGNPAFADPAADDYQLTVASEARDAGDPAGVPPAPKHDILGVPRPQGPRVDIGAYEWKGHWRYLPLVYKQSKPIIGWAVGDSIGGYGTILHTVDGGASWVRQGKLREVPDVDLRDVSAVDEANAWVVGQRAILRTRDGGRTWEPQSLPTDAPADTELFGVKAIDGSTAWAVGNPDVLLGTTDGRTWNVMSRGADLHLPWPVLYADVDAADATHVWAVGGTGEDGRGEPVIAFYDGVQWRRQGADAVIRGNEATLIGVSARDHATAWAVGGAGFVPFPMATTTDGGASWQQVGQPPIPGRDTNRVVAVTSDIGWASGDDGNVGYTTDAGATWTPASLPSAYLYGITAMDDKNAWVVGVGGDTRPPGVIARTRDALHWKVQPDPSWPNLYGISIVGARR